MIKWFKKLIITTTISLLFFAAFCFYYYKYIENKITVRFEGQLWETPSKVFSASEILKTGDLITTDKLIKFLENHGFTHTEFYPRSPGEFLIETPFPETRIIIYTKDFYSPSITTPSALFRIEINIGNVLTIHSVESGQPIEKLYFNQSKVTEFYGSNRHERKLKKLSDIPPHLLYAIICAEDKRFLSHRGIDPRGILRALYTDIRHGSMVEGGSTITQQLVKNLFLSHKKSLVRKFNEAIMAIILENHYTKDDILEAYINEIYMGQNGSLEVRGMGQAARFYFNKEVKDLTIAESAFIAGLIPAPGTLSPFKNLTSAMNKQKQVLKKMLMEKTITRYEYVAAKNAKIHFAKKNPSRVLNKAPFFIDHLKYELSINPELKDITTKDYRIYSTLEMKHQKIAKRAIKEHLERLEHDYSWLSKPANPSHKSNNFDPNRQMNIEAALISVRPQTCQITASVGGRNYRYSNFNRVVYGSRQPGSVFKPFIFLTSFNDTSSIEKITPETPVSNSPLKIEYDGQSWTPENYDKKWSQPVSIFQILSESLNVPAVRVARETGFENIGILISKMGLKRPDYIVPSIALGSFETTLLEIAAAYSTIANGGFFCRPTTISGITDNRGALIFKNELQKERVVSRESSYLVAAMMNEVIKSGTGRLATKRGLSRGFYGKTGTSSNYHDAWFAGFTRDLVVVVRVGFDTERNLDLTGGIAALPIWIEFMKSIYSDRLPQPLEVPENIVFKEVNAGKSVKKVPFLKGTENLAPPIIE